MRGMTTLTSEPSRLLTVKDVARTLKTCTRTIRRWSAKGLMPPPRRVKRSVRWCAMEIQAWLDRGCPPWTGGFAADCPIAPRR
jgi:predicted DNA-binding transcriptional regulator AlpA